MSDQTSAARASDLIEHFHLDAQCHDSYTLITSPIPGRRNAKATQKWGRSKRIGQGAFGLVWLEEQEGTKALRAVKELQKDTVSRHESTTTYANELYALAKFSKFTDHFADFYGWYETPGSLYLSMEYFPLGDLSRHLDHPFPEAEAREIVSQLASGLEVIHMNNITHRDLKPQNVFVVEKSPNWWVKIGDFGVSKRFSETSALQTVVGTVLFMAPEIVDDDDDDETYTNAVDMWSLGCIVYLLLCFEYPFNNTRDLRRYARGKVQLSLKPLQVQETSLAGINLVQALLSSSSKDRPSASLVTKDKWLQDLLVTTIPANDHISDNVNRTDWSLVDLQPSIETTSLPIQTAEDLNRAGSDLLSDSTEIAMSSPGYNALQGSRILRKALPGESIPEGMVLIRVITEDTFRGYTGRGVFDTYSGQSQNAHAICYWAPPWSRIQEVRDTLREHKALGAGKIRLWPLVRKKNGSTLRFEQPCQNYDETIVNPETIPYNRVYYWAELVPDAPLFGSHSYPTMGTWRLVFLKRYEHGAGDATTGIRSLYIDTSFPVSTLRENLTHQMGFHGIRMLYAEHDLYKRVLGYDMNQIGIGYPQMSDIPNGAIFCIEQD